MIAPAWFAVLSIFHILRGFYRGLFPNFIRRMKFSLMKQLVAPESTSALVSAIALLVLIETGMCMDWNRIVTITELNLWTALTQANGFRRSENPLFQQDPSSPVLVRLLLLLLLRGAMNWLVVEGFEWLIVPLLVVLLRLQRTSIVDYCFAFLTWAWSPISLPFVVVWSVPHMLRAIATQMSLFVACVTLNFAEISDPSSSSSLLHVPSSQDVPSSGHGCRVYFFASGDAPSCSSCRRVHGVWVG